MYSIENDLVYTLWVNIEKFRTLHFGEKHDQICIVWTFA